MKKIIIGSLIGSLFLYGCGREIKQRVKVEVSGSVSALMTSGEFSLKPAEGAIVKLQADFNGDGKILNNEMEMVNVDSHGRFEASMWIPEDFKGYVVLIVEKKGYISIIKTFPAGGIFQTNILLYPAENATCKKGKCYVPSKRIIVENIPENVVGGEMAVFNPVYESEVFPGNFFDSEGKMLISTVFGEIKLYDENGNEVKEGKDLKVKMLIPVDTYGTLEDLNPDTERVEVPMFYFDETKGVWVESVEGYLEYEGGKEVKRAELQSIKEGKYAGNIYSVFYAPHLSWWNLDWSNPYVTCLMGRVLIDGKIESGVYVKATGINYKELSGYRIITKTYTKSDGWFVVSVFKSEPQNIDEDGDGIKGEIHKTSISVSYNGQTWNIGEFISPQRYSPYMEGNNLCQPPNCPCGNLGDINLSTTPSPPCELYGIVKYSGIENIYYGSGNPPPAGSPVPGVNVAIFDENMSPERRNEICMKDGQDLCVSQRTDDSGRFHIYYAVDTSATYSANLVLQSGDVEEGFRGSGSISGCPSSSPENPYVITVDYYYKGNEKYPTAPQALTASAECGELVTLSWIDRSDNEDGFIIERKKEGENYNLLADLPPDTSLHYDSTTKRNTSYCYRVIAYRTEGGVKYSSPSHEFCYTTPSKFCPPPPPSPSNLSGIMSPSLVSLTWKEVSREKGYKITRRIVTDGPCSEGGGELPIETVYNLGYIEIGVAGEDASSFNDLRIKPLTCYCYRVFAFNDAGNSGSSNPFCGVVPECNEGETRTCYTGPQGTLGIGVCAAGIQTCSSGRWGECEGEILPSEEICDGYDNNCNGYVDEGENLIGSSPFYRDVDEDGYGTSDVKYLCYAQPPYSAIVNGDCDDNNLSFNPAAQEICDGYDNNCDTNVDEGCNCVDGETQPCYSGPPGTEGVGVCRGGTQTCYNGEWGECEGQVVPSDDICGDNLDNDCDGYTDETCDEVPPETILVSYPPGMTTATSATFEFICNEEPCTYKCRIDGSEWNSCTSPITYTDLALGQHTFEVKAYDWNMNEDPTPAVHQWKIMSALVDMLWENELGIPVESSPVPADVNGDGVPEIIITTKNPAKVYCLNGQNGEIIWAYNPSEPDLNFTTPSIGDIDNDGNLEIVFGSYYAKVYALNAEDGSVLWIYTTGYPSTFYSVTSTPIIRDLNADGIPDVIVPSYLGGIHVLRGTDGSLLKTYSTSGWYVMNSSPAYGDVNQNGGSDIVVGGFENNTNIFAVSLAGAGYILWSYSTGGGIRSSPSIGDLNHDGNLDTVVGSFDGKIYAIGGTGQLLWSYTTQREILSSPAIADINHDGILDVVIGSRDKSIYAIKGDNGSLLWSFETNGEIDSSPVIGDVDGDGNLEVIVGSSDKHLYALNGEDGSLLWKYLLNNSIKSSPVLGDFNGDGTIDIVISDEAGKVYVLTTFFDLPHPSLLPWPEFGNRAYMRTRNVDPWEHNNGEIFAIKLIDSGFSYNAIPGYIWNYVSGLQMDYYSVKLYPSSATEIVIYLTDIPSGRDYDLCLYDQWMIPLSCSENPSNYDELIIYPLLLTGPETFYIEVYSVSGHSPAHPYSLFIDLQ